MALDNSSGRDDLRNWLIRCSLTTLTHKIEDGMAPIQQLAIPHVYNLTVNPDEDLPYNHAEVHSWVLYKVYGPKTKELQESLKKDSVPFGAPLDFNPYKR